MSLNTETKLVSKNKFYEQQYSIIEKMTAEKINAYYAESKTRTKLFFAEIGLFVGAILFSISFLLLLIFGYLAFFSNSTSSFVTQLKNNQNRIIWIAVLSILSIFNLLLMLLGFKKREQIKQEVVKKFNSYDIYKYIFKYFGLEEKFNRDEKNVFIPKYEQINFFRNIKNFNDIQIGTFAIVGKYPIYDLVTDDQYIKMQNLEYFSSKWYDLRLLAKKEAKKYLSKSKKSYMNQIEVQEYLDRFGLAVKLRNLKESISLTLFDKDNIYTPEEFEIVELDKKYSDLYIKTESKNELLPWLEENNLAFLEAIKNELNAYKYQDSTTIKNNLVNKLSLLIKKQEAFIWFDSSSKLLDLEIKLKTINKNKIIKTFVSRLIDDIYLIYLLLQLLVPFGLKLKDFEFDSEIKQMEEENKKPIENKEQNEELLKNQAEE
ncbi:MAG2810 family protein [Mycoplasmopsis hyopharyngis]|uniref:MAG2810 family protein n=1 Tax=Mycoplasmopsis hyopharyngis TaxID=29558 RepID=UPI00387373F5